MVSIDESFAVADCGAGKDIAATMTWRKNDLHPRVLRGYLVAGANAVNECVLEFKVDGVVLATIKNQLTGAAPVTVEFNKDWYTVLSNVLIPAGKAFELTVKTAPTVNPIRVMLEVPEI